MGIVALVGGFGPPVVWWPAADDEDPTEALDRTRIQCEDAVPPRGVCDVREITRDLMSLRGQVPC